MCTAAEWNCLMDDLVREYRNIYGVSLREDLSRTFAKLGKVASELSLAYGLTVSPTAIPFADYKKYQTALPYYWNIQTNIPKRS